MIDWGTMIGGAGGAGAGGAGHFNGIPVIFDGRTSKIQDAARITQKCDAKFNRRPRPLSLCQ